MYDNLSKKFTVTKNRLPNIRSLLNIKEKRRHILPVVSQIFGIGRDVRFLYGLVTKNQA